MRINIVENWNVKSKKDKSRENISIPYAYSVEEGKNSKKKIRFTKQFKINAKKGDADAAKKRRYVLEFEGICANCTIELNGRKIGEHKGSFLPFSIDITPVILFNEKNKLLIVVDNNPNNNILGCSKTSKNLYENFVGIIRDVWLNIIEKESFSTTMNEKECHDNCFIYQEKVVEDGVPNYYLCADCGINFIESPNEMYVIATLADSAKNIISRTKFKYNSDIKEDGFMVKVPVPDAILWSPEFPYMYYLRLELFSKDMVTGEYVVVDQRIYKKGIREFSVKDGKFYVNGEETRIKGVCHHQVYPVIGMTTSRRAEFREILKLKNAGFNTIRLVNYPASKEFYEACDTLGMLVINCVPNNGGFYNTPEFIESVKNTFSELAYRDRNCTSIAMWEASIGDFTAKDGLTDDLIKECIEIVKSIFPHGKAPLIIGDTSTRPETAATLGYDIAYCSYNQKTRLPENIPGMPAYLIGSFGLDGYKYDKKDKKMSYEQKMAEQAWAYQFILNQNATHENFIGAIAAQDVDYSNGKDKMVMGLMNEYRLPKTAYYFFQSQDIAAKPMVYIPHPKLATLIDNMQVYTNCDTIKVYINDEPTATYPVKKGATTPYYMPDYKTTQKAEYADYIKQQINMGNNEFLDHPPVSLGDSLKNIGDKAVRVDGLIDGQIVRSMTVNNSNVPYKLRIFVDYGGIALANDERDFVFVHVALIDDTGNIVSRDGERITLSIKGGNIINYSESKTIGGVSSYMVRAFEGTDRVLLKAISKGKTDIKEAYAKIIIKP